MEELYAVDDNIDLTVLAERIGVDKDYVMRLMVECIKGLRGIVTQQEHRIRELEEMAMIASPRSARLRG